MLRILQAVMAAGLTAMFAMPATAQEPTESQNYVVFAGRDSVTFARMADELSKADVVCVGENHDHKLGHKLELAILLALHQRRPRTTLSLEFFERDVQTVLDEYLHGYITESYFKQSSRPWPTYATDYAPMVEYCKTNHLDVVAANAPRRYVNIVSRKGREALAELPKESRQNLPRLPYAMEIPEGYDQMLTGVFGGATHTAATTAPATAPTAPAMPAMNIDHMKEAQGLWDATMADSVLRYRKSHRGALVVQMNGGGHTDHGWGIVDRLRKSDPKLKVVVVSIKPDAAFPNLPANTYEGVADYLILSLEESTKDGKAGR